MGWPQLVRIAVALGLSILTFAEHHIPDALRPFVHLAISFLWIWGV